MKSRFTAKPVFWLILILTSVGSFNSLLLNQLNDYRDDYGLTRMEPLENAPPALAFSSVALGGFRGLIANYLWIRTTNLEDRGQYFEGMTLAGWITKLQPTFGAVWAHLGWNMVYNISKQFNDPQDRWTWVNAGIRLLRDEGLRYNPRDPLLYQELAWFYHHKIGKAFDDAHYYYKQVLALEMKTLIGSPTHWPALLNPQTTEELSRVIQLKEKHGLHPEFLKSVDEEFGPLDWRLPESLAIYWAAYGLEQCGKSDLLPLRRIIWQSMSLAFQRGRMIEDELDQKIDYAPNLEIIDKVNQTFLDSKEAEPEKQFKISRGHRTFLKLAIYSLFTYGRIQEAADWFLYLGREYPDDPEIIGKTLAQFAMEQTSADAVSGNMTQNRSIIGGLIINAYNAFVLGEDDRGNGYMLLAMTIHERYQQKIVGEESRIGLPSFQKLKETVSSEILQGKHGFSSLKLQRLVSLFGTQPTDGNAPQN
ncbi:MAG TPA: hypothetical protein EYQ50_28340 [Verrucomicrobiales bacterium]|nr:hypothetical protein [Verrucomicrobiales bacterium]